LAQNEMHFKRHIPLMEIVENIEAVTGDEIQAIADRLFSTSKASLTVLGQIRDKEAYANILEPLTSL